jgi:benzoyl-CoA reductase/2-hydroxyglutaryl-CoA dehydratase subunit BcrC/BadD/HgdB
MNQIIKWFGETVGSNIESNPDLSLKLLKAGYAASGIQMKYLPDKSLLPNQKYSSVICNKTIRYPLSHPESSAVINIFFPCELLHAVGISPLFVEGISCYLNGAEAEQCFIDYSENFGVPKSYCSYHKTLLGAAYSNVLPKPKFIVNTTLACDANILTFRSLAEYWGIPHFTIDIPNSCNAEAVNYVESQIREAISFMESSIGRKIDTDKFKEIIRCENRSLSLYKEYFNELSQKFIKNNLTSEMYKLFFTHILVGTEEAENYYKLLLEDAKKAEVSKDKVRIMWVHTMPYWQESIKSIFNNSEKYQLLSIDMNFDAMVELDEDEPFKSLARKLLTNSMRGTVKRRAEKILEIAKYLNADGVIYFNHWGCKQTLGGSRIAKEILEENKIPTLLLDGDGCDRKNVNDGQMVTRLQAFLEILEGGK